MCTAIAVEGKEFDAAVKLIKSLPKNGSFQPSNELKLRLYGLYKQATIGPCRQHRPAFWDVVSRAKWDAWNALNNMSTEQAKKEYVESLKQVVETMPIDENVEQFLESMGPFYEFVGDVSKSTRINGEYNNNNISKLSINSVAVGKVSNKYMKPVTVSEYSNGKIITSKYSGFSENDDNLYSVDNDARGLSESNQANTDFNFKGKIENDTDSYVLELNNSLIDEVHELMPQSDEEFADANDDAPYNSNCGLNLYEDKVLHTKTDDVFDHIPLDTSAKNRGNDSSKFLKRLSRHNSTNRKRTTVENGNLLPDTFRNYLPFRYEFGYEPVTELDEMFEDVWNSVSTLRRDTEIGLFEQSILLKSLSKNDKALNLKKSKGHGNGESQNQNTNSINNRNENTGNSNLGESSAGQNDRTDAAGASEVGVRSAGGFRDRRNNSGDSSGGTSSSIELVEWDSHVTQVLTSMHRELKQISRQLGMMEQILIGQQRLLRHTLSIVSDNELFASGWIFPRLSSRSVAFILLWPFVVYFILGMLRRGHAYFIMRRLRRC